MKKLLILLMIIAAPVWAAEPFTPAHEALGLGSPVQRRAWKWIVGRGGRPVRTDLLAESLGYAITAWDVKA